MIDDELIAVLSIARPPERPELTTFFDLLLADVCRFVAVRKKINPGRAVRLMDCRTGQVRAGEIVAIKHS